MDLFQKDYVFIPIHMRYSHLHSSLRCQLFYEMQTKMVLLTNNFFYLLVYFSSHWSLVILCHPGSLSHLLPGRNQGTPCILHLDSMASGHQGIEEHIQEYVQQALVEKNGSLEAMSFRLEYIEVQVYYS